MAIKSSLRIILYYIYLRVWFYIRCLFILLTIMKNRKEMYSPNANCIISMHVCKSAGDKEHTLFHEI